MSQQAPTQKVEEAVQAWDLYCAGEYTKVLQEFGEANNGEVRDIRTLAELEMQKDSIFIDVENQSIFTPLLAAMHAYHTGDYEKTPRELGSWLLGKNFFSVEILKRFADAARRSGNFSLLVSVARKYLEYRQYHPVIAAPLFDGAYQAGKYEEAIALWKKFQKYLSDSLFVQRAAFCMIQTGQYADAESILLDAYRKIHGTPYRLNYDDVARRYEATIKNLPELEKKADPADFDAQMELGMAYLFDRQYDRAAKVFLSVKSRFG